MVEFGDLSQSLMLSVKGLNKISEEIMNFSKIRT